MAKGAARRVRFMAATKLNEQSQIEWRAVRGRAPAKTRRGRLNTLLALSTGANRGAARFWEMLPLVNPGYSIISAGVANPTRAIARLDPQLLRVKRVREFQANAIWA
jgi:hypothetical protein